MVENNWPIAQLHERYDKFINDFRDFLNMVEDGEFTELQAFQLRILLVHQYRRILLKDPSLPLWAIANRLVSIDRAQSDQ